MKAAVIIFHKNVGQYPKVWTRQCVDSIMSQTYKDYDVWELNYGGPKVQVFPKSLYVELDCPDHADAQNFLLDMCKMMKYDCVFNVNIDDFYRKDRFELQIKAIQQGFDVISSNFVRVDENGNHLRRY
jgi:hypothetical protein